MKGYEIARSDQILVIRRRKGRALVPLLFSGSLLCLMLVIPFSNIFIYHYFIWGNVWLAVFVTLLTLPLLIGDGRYLGKRVVILDKRLDQVLVNERRVCAFTDVSGVKLGSYIVPTAKNLPFKMHGLYLETAKGEAVEIERLTLAGPSRHDLKEVGLAIASFADIKSNIP